MNYHIVSSNSTYTTSATKGLIPALAAELFDEWADSSG